MIIKRESFMFVILWVMSATPRECSLYSVEAEAQQDDLPRHQLTAGRATTGLLVCWFPVQPAPGVQVAQRHLVLHLCTRSHCTLTVCLPCPLSLERQRYRGVRKEREKWKEGKCPWGRWEAGSGAFAPTQKGEKKENMLSWDVGSFSYSLQDLVLASWGVISWGKWP